MKLIDYSIEELEQFKLRRRLPEDCELSFEELPEELQEKLFKHRRNIRKMIEVIIKWKLKRDEENVEKEFEKEEEENERKEREIRYSPAIPLFLREEKLRLKKEELELKKLKLEKEEAILSRLNSLIDEIKELRKELKVNICKKCNNKALGDICVPCMIMESIEEFRKLQALIIRIDENGKVREVEEEEGESEKQE